MKSIDISNDIILNHCDDVDEPIIIHMYGYPDYREKEFVVKQVRMAIQIFHTDLKHFDLRKATLIDPDERRPVYGFVFDDSEKQIAFFTKRMEYMMAAQQIELIDVGGKLVVRAVRNMGRSLYRLRSFCSWMEHMAGRGGEGVFTKDCEVIEVDGGSILHVPDITIDDLIACLKGEKQLVREERDQNVAVTKTTVDGVELTADEFIKHMTQKAMLERMPEGAMN